jgi:hypothetical protein
VKGRKRWAHGHILGFSDEFDYLSRMTNVEQSLLHALNDLATRVQSMPAANPKPNLLPIFARLDELAEELPRNSDPTLLHYLQKKSYEKARLHLLGREKENQRGTCAP